MSKLAYVPLVADTDIVYPSVRRALVSGLLAVEREAAREPAAADALWAKAFAALDRDRQQLDGDAEVTEIQTYPGSGFANVPWTE